MLPCDLLSEIVAEVRPTLLVVGWSRVLSVTYRKTQTSMTSRQRSLSTVIMRLGSSKWRLYVIMYLATVALNRPSKTHKHIHFPNLIVS